MYGDERALETLTSLQAAAATWPHITLAEIHPALDPVSAARTAKALVLVSHEWQAYPSYRLQIQSFTHRYIWRLSTGAG